MNNVLTTLIAVLLLGFSTLNAQNFSTHQVKEGETVVQIAKKYHITPADIYGLNPDTKKGLKPNTILIIPISKATKPQVTETKELQGFKKHKTKRKETLFGISKKYNVKVEDLKRYNEFLYANNLRKGDKLQIPIYKITVIEDDKLVKEYTVLPKEGKWRVAYKFGITVAKLEELNPNMGEVLKEGEKIKVPNIEKTDVKEIDETFSYYKVLPKEGFYRLKLKLGLEQQQLEVLNPDLVESGLKEGMILKIPFNESNEDLTVSNLVNNITDFDTKHIALMLPFRLNNVDFDAEPNTKESIENDPYLDVSLDFYSGILVALDSLKTLGVSVKLDVYDTKYESSTVSRLLLDNNFENVDAVIGPLTTKNFNIVASKLKPYNIPVVSPIGTNLKLLDNVFQSRPADNILKDKIVNYVKLDSVPKNIIIISDSKNSKVANALKQDFNASTMVYSRKNKEDKDEYFVTKGDIDAAIKPGKNLVFLETQNEGFASNVTSILASTTYKELPNNEKLETEIALATTRFNGAFEGDEINNIHLSKLKFMYATTSKSYNDDSNSFVKKYYNKFNITPNRRAVKGFDLAMDVVLRLVTSEDLFTSVVNARLTAYVENKFAYKKKMFGGYYNNAIYLVQYDNLQILELK